MVQGYFDLKVVIKPDVDVLVSWPKFDPQSYYNKIASSKKRFKMSTP